MEDRPARLYPDGNLDTDTCLTIPPITDDATINHLLPTKLRGGSEPRILLADVTADMGLFPGRAE